MNVGVNILNRSYEANDEFILFQTNSEARDLPDRIQELMTVEEWVDTDQGDWITVVDGEIVNRGSSHPFLIIAEEDEEEWIVKRTKTGGGVAGPFTTREQAAMCREALENETDHQYFVEEAE